MSVIREYTMRNIGFELTINHTDQSGSEVSEPLCAREHLDYGIMVSSRCNDIDNDRRMTFYAEELNDGNTIALKIVASVEEATQDNGWNAVTNWAYIVLNDR